MERSKFSDGFSLIELAIVLAIIGVIGGISLPLVSHFMDRSKQKVSIQRHEQILRSLAGYVLANGKLPYAADPAATGLTFGNVTKGCTHGLVPFKEIGLDASMVKDGYGNFITYVVHKELCEIQKPREGRRSLRENADLSQPRPSALGQPKRSSSNLGKGGALGPGSSSGPRASRFTSTRSGSVVEEAQGHADGPAHNKSFCNVKVFPYTIDTPQGEHSKLSIVLISSGAGGHGAYQANGTRTLKNSSNSGRLEDANRATLMRLGTTFYKRPFSSHKERLFRHYVTGVTRDNLMAIYAQYPCRK